MTSLVRWQKRVTGLHRPKVLLPTAPKTIHAVTDRERRDGTADRVDHLGELAPEDARPEPDQTGEETYEERLGRPQGAVSPVHRRRMQPVQYVAVGDGRLVDVIAAVDPAPSPCRTRVRRRHHRPTRPARRPWPYPPTWRTPLRRRPEPPDQFGRTAMAANVSTASATADSRTEANMSNGWPAPISWA